MPGTHDKSSPLYKGIGKYKRKPKGKRGFKMKSPLRNEGVKTVIEIRDGEEYLTRSKGKDKTTYTKDPKYGKKGEKGKKWITKEGGEYFTN
tara:strand:+ start:210 stop:482 length:273 start_codon:yes stop_codon:yes gene_type:complete